MVSRASSTETRRPSATRHRAAPSGESMAGDKMFANNSTRAADSPLIMLIYICRIRARTTCGRYILKSAVIATPSKLVLRVAAAALTLAGPAHIRSGNSLLRVYY
ncbi:hypothetical protein O3G_MSEX011277 [Manduca sexta]|uniref:Uncharacterized protein n=1 Tax=Manduca sexta TaxID=7130 RepID=A0A922CV20_MANSE|nr:hypothetical protein O3G_MSEX011277 [Manduca sexta]